MRVFFATSPGVKHVALLKECEVENMLISFHFIKSPERLLKIMNGYKPKNLIIDSGAFSVWSNGGRVDIDKYAEFCKGVQKILPPEVRMYMVNLDVLPGKFGVRPTEEERHQSAEQGWENMLYLEAKGFKVIHIFHQHEDFSVLKKLMAHSDYIGISPANDVSMNEKINWLRQVFSITRDKIKTHGFAVTSYSQLYQFPFYSVDSSTWISPARFGRIPVFTDDLKLKSFQYKDKEGLLEYWDYVKHIGITMIAKDDWRDRVKIAIKSFQNLEKIATNLWTKRGIVWKD